LQPAEGKRPDFVNAKFNKSYYYSLEATNLYLAEERTYANCRGPGFVECYERYDETTQSQWGVTGLTVIVPKFAAPGKPWVLRADAITRDAVHQFCNLQFSDTQNLHRICFATLKYSIV